MNIKYVGCLEKSQYKHKYTQNSDKHKQIKGNLHATEFNIELIYGLETQWSETR